MAGRPFRFNNWQNGRWSNNNNNGGNQWSNQQNNQRWRNNNGGYGRSGSGIFDVAEDMAGLLQGIRGLGEMTQLGLALNGTQVGSQQQTNNGQQNQNQA